MKEGHNSVTNLIKMREIIQERTIMEVRQAFHEFCTQPASSIIGKVQN